MLATILFLLLIGETVADTFQHTLYTGSGEWILNRLPRSISASLNITNAIATRDPDAALVSQTEMDLPWEQFIIHGPMTVNLLGQLMVVSSKLDFSFRDYQADFKFQYMRFPDSFRATLTQIANDGWQAFLAAHMNMNRIQQSMERIPTHVKRALQVLGSRRATARLIASILPITLREIERIGKSCVLWTNNTHNTFVDVMNLMGEVISSTEVTRGVAENRLRQTQMELNASRVMQTELSKVGETIRSHYNEAREAVQKAQSEYSRALRRIPTGFKALLLDLGRAVISLVKSSAPVILGAITGGISTAMGAIGSAGSAVQNVGNSIAGAINNNAGKGGVSLATSQVLPFGKIFSESITKGVSRLKNLLKKGNSNNSKDDPVQEADAYKVTYETFLESIPTENNSPLKGKTGNLIKRGIDLFTKVSAAMKKSASDGEQVDPEVAKNLEATGETLVADTKPLEAAETLGGSEVPPAPSSGSASGDASGDSSQNEKFVAQLSMNRLRDAETRYDKIFEHLKQNQEDLAKLMAKIATLDMNQVHYKELIELLREALRLLSRVREQWGQLVLFFAEIATKAEIVLGATLTPFINQATEAGNDRFTVDERLFYVDILKSQADDIEVQAGMLYTMSRTYYDMSGRFIMRRLAGLSKMLTAANDNERNQLLSELNSNTQDTQAAVLSLVSDRKYSYQQALKKRRAELADFIAKLGGPDSDNQLAIEAGRELLKSAS